MHSEQFSVAFCAVDVSTVGSAETETTWPLPPVHIPAESIQQGATPPLAEQGWTVLSMKPPL
jgi:hypothetical protein